MKKKLWTLSIFFLLLSVVLITNAYGLFETNGNASNDIPIGKWVIKLDGKDITKTSNITLDNFTFNNGTHTEDGYFAPGSTASFDLVMDTSESQVAVAYSLTADITSLADHPNITFAFSDPSGNSTVTNNGLTISGNILVADLATNKTFHLAMTWTNDATYDTADSKLIKSSLPITITGSFTQYTGA